MTTGESPLAAIERLASTWDDQASEWYYANRYTPGGGNDYAAGFEDGWTHAADLLRQALRELQ